MTNKIGLWSGLRSSRLVTKKLLLTKNVKHLGIVGDVVNVAPGYARNYLVPQGLATEPTDTNMRALAEARRVAEQERALERKQLESLATRLEGAEVTIRARANEDGVLYGSVSADDIAAALAEEGIGVRSEQIVLDRPIRHLDNLSIEVKLADDLRSAVKVWIVRDKIEGEDLDDEEASNQTESGTEAGTDGDDTAG